jgi:hypothetical protein
MTVKPYMDPTTGEWVGEHETPLPEGDVSRQTEWFATEQEARHFARRGTNHRPRHSHLRPAAGQRVGSGCRRSGPAGWLAG